MSSFAAVLLAEALLRILPDWNPYNWDRRIMLFKGSRGSVFENTRGGGFRYAKDSWIETETYYATSGWTSCELEFAYSFRTNNFGLAQGEDLRTDRPSLLVVGDSFTEGQGAEPWLDGLAQALPRMAGQAELQIVNGGILGTGIVQFEQLLSELTVEGLSIRKVAVVFISDDWTRKKWSFPDDVLDCIAHFDACTGNEGYYGLPASEGKAEFLARVLRARRPGPSLIRSLSLYKRLYKPLRWGSGAEELEKAFEQNKAAALRLIESVGRPNLAFIQLPAKDEILRKKMNPYGSAAREFLGTLGVPVAGGITSCGLGESDYYAVDGHPNRNGYAKIRSCVLRLLTQAPGFLSSQR